MRCVSIKRINLIFIFKAGKWLKLKMYCTTGPKTNAKACYSPKTLFVELISASNSLLEKRKMCFRKIEWNHFGSPITSLLRHTGTDMSLVSKPIAFALCVRHCIQRFLNTTPDSHNPVLATCWTGRAVSLTHFISSFPTGQSTLQTGTVT